MTAAGPAWTFVARANRRPGDAEVWTARAASTRRYRVTATLATPGYDESLTVAALTNDDWDHSIRRTPARGHGIVHQAFDAAGNTFWIQQVDTPTTAAGQPVTVNDLQLLGDEFNMLAVEAR